MLIDRIMMNESINEWMVEVFCSDAANEAMDEWQLAQGSTQPRVTQSRQTNHCALQIIVQGRTKFSVQNTEPQNKSLRIADHCARQNKVLSAAGLVQRRPRIEASSNFLYYKTEPSSQCREKNSHHMQEPQTLVCSIAAHGWKLAHFFQPSFH